MFECRACFGVGLFDDGRGEVKCPRCAGHGLLTCSPSCDQCAGGAMVMGLSWGEIVEAVCPNAHAPTLEAVNAWQNDFMRAEHAAMRKAAPDTKPSAA